MAGQDELKFQYANRWSNLPGGLIVPPELVTHAEAHDRQLEDYLNTLGTGGGTEGNVVAAYHWADTKASLARGTTQNFAALSVTTPATTPIDTDGFFYVSVDFAVRGDVDLGAGFNKIQAEFYARINLDGYNSQGCEVWIPDCTVTGSSAPACRFSGRARALAQIAPSTTVSIYLTGHCWDLNSIGSVTATGEVRIYDTQSNFV